MWATLKGAGAVCVWDQFMHDPVANLKCIIIGNPLVGIKTRAPWKSLSFKVYEAINEASELCPSGGIKLKGVMNKQCV